MSAAAANVDLDPGERTFDEADTERARAEFAKLQIDVGTIAVLPHIYRCWLFCCRIYRIRGRVVCRNWTYDPIKHRWGWCDDPVPGASVDIYDVDRFLWWYREDLITTVTTQFDGTFEATVVWCCSRFPWWWEGWLIDQEILRHIRELLLERNVVLKPPPPDPDPTALQELVTSLQPRPALSSAAPRRDRRAGVDVGRFRCAPCCRSRTGSRRCASGRGGTRTTASRTSSSASASSARTAKR